MARNEGEGTQTKLSCPDGKYQQKEVLNATFSGEYHGGCNQLHHMFSVNNTELLHGVLLPSRRF